MTQEEIIAGNKLIAEFLGCKLLKNGKYEITDHPYEIDSYITSSLFSSNDEYSPENMCYDLSWDWQIPVFAPLYTKINEMMVDIGGVISLIDLSYAVLTNKPFESFKILIKGIEWYNQNSEK
jgi:hypothetical protein